MRIQLVRALAALLLFPSVVFASQSFDEVVQLVKNDVSNEVIRAYIENHRDSFNLTADEIVYLNDLGLPSDLIAEMLNPGEGNATEVSYMSQETPVETSSEAVEDATVTAPEQQPDMSYFYEALSPYGTWQQDATYGWVWQPTVVVHDRSWRPYLNSGHWVWTDQGWFWQSDYSWGWAPFHYGRWAYTTSWVWVPDHVWGPAWVDWRVGDSFYGWAPLPPAARFDPGIGFVYRDRRVGFDANSDFGLRPDYFTFVPASGFLSIDLGTHLLDWHHHDDYFRRSRVVNNYYLSGRSIVNGGVPVDRVRRDTREDIPAVRIASANVRSGEAIPATYRSGNELIAYRPEIRNTTSVTPPAAIERFQRQAQQRAQRQATAEANRAHRTATRDANEAERQRRELAEQIRRRSLTANRQATREASRATDQARRTEAAQQRQEQQTQRREEQNARQQQIQQQREASAAQEAQRQQEQEQRRQQQVQEQQQRHEQLRAQEAQRQQEQEQRRQLEAQQRAEQLQERQQQLEQQRAQQQQFQQQRQLEQQQQQQVRQEEQQAREAERQQAAQQRAQEVQQRQEQRESRQSERQEAVRQRQPERGR